MTQVHNSLRACQRKRGYKTWNEANAALESLKRAGKAKPGLRTYLCANCGLYHLGAKTRWCR